MKRRGENCANESIIQTEAECREAASQFNDDDFDQTLGSRYADSPSGCFWMVEGRSMKMTFNKKSGSARVDPQLNSKFGGVCHAIG